MSKLETLARLIAASADLIDQGMMNLQKLLEALVYSVVRAESRTYRREGNPDERLAEISHLIGGLPDRSVPPEYRKVIQGVMQHYATEARGDLPYDVAPDVLVCRNCGYMAVAAAPETCPECGEAKGVYRRFQGMFNGDNAEPEDPVALFDLLDNNGRQLEQMVSGLKETDCNRRIVEGHWCIRDHVTHFFDAQVILIQRVSLILSGDTPNLSSAVPYETATDASGRPAETREILGRFLAERIELIDRLRSLSLSELWKRGRHEDFGSVSIMHQVKYFAQHEQAHLGTVATLRSAVTA
jgi:hypothetical protein